MHRSVLHLLAAESEAGMCSLRFRVSDFWVALEVFFLGFGLRFLGLGCRASGLNDETRSALICLLPYARGFLRWALRRRVQAEHISSTAMAMMKAQRSPL